MSRSKRAAAGTGERPPLRVISTNLSPRESASIQVDRLDPSTLPLRVLLWRLVRTARYYDAAVLEGSTGFRQRYVDEIAAALLAALRNGPMVVISDCTWAVGSDALARLAARVGLSRLRGKNRPFKAVARAAVWAMDSPRTVFCVLTRHEQAIFWKTWGVAAERVAFTPFFYTMPHEDLDQPVVEDGSVFAGGDSLRDYEPLLEAARGLPAQVNIATSKLDERVDLPPNVDAGRVPHERFVEAMKAASVVVVPLQATESERSAGQQTFLNAMAIGKLVIVTDTPGVRDYVTDGETGLVVPAGDPFALREALRWVLDSNNRDAVKAIRDRAREVARREFSLEAYEARLLRVVEQAVSRRAASTPPCRVTGTTRRAAARGRPWRPR